jgi:hypothetical protein
VNVTVGGYAAAHQDWGGADLASFYATLAALPAVGGLELPAAQLGQLASAQAGTAAWADRLEYEVTSLPATMSACSHPPNTDSRRSPPPAGPPRWPTRSG